MVNLPDDKSSDAFYGQGYQVSPSDGYFNNIESLRSLAASGGRVFRAGPSQGLYLDGDADFRKLNIGINRNDNYMSLFMAHFTLETGPTGSVARYR